MIAAYPHNLRGIIIIAILMAALMFWYIHMNSKQKKDYESITGQITYLGKTYKELPNRDFEKYRYLKVRGYGYPFEIFIGKDRRDFKPKFEQLNKLKTGDTITVYYYETNNTIETGINRFVQFIDKKNQSFFERGDSSKTLGIIVIGLCGLLIILGIELYKRKKVSF